MKLKEHITHEDLIAAGFEKIDQEEAAGRDDPIAADYEYSLKLGYSRRGQWYFVFIGEDRVLRLYASAPDGDGGSLELPEKMLDVMRLVEA